MQFAERLRELMEQGNVSTYRMSKDLGMPDSLIGFWMRELRQPTMKNLIKLADYFDVSLDYLVGRSDNPERR